MYVQKDGTSLQKQYEASKPILDGVDVQLYEKSANYHLNSRPVFHRPFLDVEDSSPPEKLFKLCGSKVQNGICAVPASTQSFSSVMQRIPSCTSNSESGGNPTEVKCESSRVDANGLSEPDCGGVRDEDGGRDRRLNAALGLISLADVSSDASQVQMKPSIETTSGDCTDG